MLLLSKRLFSSSLAPTKLTSFYRPLFLHGNILSLSSDLKDENQIVGWTKNTESDRLHIDFTDNPAMKKQIFRKIRQNLTKSSYLNSMAANYQDGWMHIADGRAMSIFSRCPEPDDIIATVLVRDGKMLPETLESMPTHRLLTINGLFQLPADIDKI